MEPSEFIDVDLTEKSLILSKLTSAGIAIDIMTECRNRGIEIEDLKESLKDSLNKGVSDVQLLLSDVDGILEKIVKNKRVTSYQLSYAQELLTLLNLPWANVAGEVLKKDMYTASDRDRLERAIRQLKQNRERFNRIRAGDQKAFDLVTFRRLTDSIEHLQRTLFKDWIEEVNTLEQSGEETYDLLAVN